MRLVERLSAEARPCPRLVASFLAGALWAIVVCAAAAPALAQTTPRQAEIPSGGLFGATGLEDAAYDVAFGPDGTAYVVGGGVQDPEETFESYSDDAFVLALAPDGTTRWTHWLAGTRDYRLDPTCAELAEGGMSCARWEPDPRGLGGADVALAVDVRGNRVVVAGHTYSADFPVAGPGQQTPFLSPDPTRNSRRDAFVTVFDSLFGTVVTSTYAGGNDDDLVVDVAFTSDDSFIVIGQSRSDLTVNPTIAPPPAVNGPASGWWQEFRRTDEVPDTWVASAPVALQGSSDVQLVRSLPLGAERWVFGHDTARPLWWRFTGAGAPPTLQAMTVGAEAALVDVFEIGTNGAGEPLLAVVGVTTGTVGGFDGAACDAVVGTACGSAPCGTLSDVFVARLRGGHCERVTYLGGSHSDVPFAASYSRYDATRNWLAVAGRTTSGDFPTRGAQQSEATGPLGFGREAFFTLLDLDTGQVRLSTYLGLRPPFLDGLVSSDDVATGVALGPNREAILVGSTWTGLGSFIRPLPFSRPFVVGDNGQAFVARLPLDVAELGVSADFAPAVADLSGPSTLTVYLTNEGTMDATNVAVVVVPTDIVLEAAGTGGLCRPSGPALICGPPGDRVAEGASATITIPATAPAARGRYEVAVTATANEYDPNTANNETKATLIVGGVDLSVQIAPQGSDSVASAAAVPVAIDESYAVRVTVENLGGESAGARLTLASTQPSRAPLEVTGLPGECTAAAGGRTPVTCTFSALQRGAPRVLDIAFALPADTALGLRTLTEVRAGLVASVAVTGTTPDANPGNDRATALASFRQPDIAFVSGAATSAAVGWGRPFSFRLEARNAGPGGAQGVTAQLDTAFENATLPTGCSRDATLISCTAPAGFDPLDAGQNVVWTIPLVAPPRVDGEPPRAVRIDSSVTHRYGELDLTNNTGEAIVQVGAVDVQAIPPAPGANYRTGIAEPITWSVINRSEETATDVTFGLTISNAGGVELPVARVNGESCALVSSPTHIEATCPIGTLTPGSGELVTLELRAGGRGTLTQAAIVTTTEPNASASSFPVVQTDTVLGPDLTSALRVPSGGPVRGQRYVVDFDVSNGGQGRSTTVSPNTTYRVSGAFEDLVHGLPSASCTEEVASTTPGTQTIRCKQLYEPSSGPATASVVLTPTRVGPLTLRIDAADREDENATNGTQERVVTVRGAALSAALSRPSSVEVGESFEIEVPIQNAGPADAAQPRLLISWDSSTSLIVDGSTPSGCVEVPGGLQCDLTLANGAETTVRVPLRAQRSGTASFIIGLQERGDPGASVLTGSGSVTVTRPDVALTATTLTPRATVAPSEPLVASFRLANQSTTTAAGPLRLRIWNERVPGSTGCAAPLTLESLTSGVSCSSDGRGGSTCDVPRLEANEFDDLEVRATAACTGRAQLRAELTYTGTDTGPDPVPSNDRAHHTIEVSEPAFAITFDPAAPSGPFTEDLTVSVTIRAVGGGSIPAGAVASFSPPLGTELASVSIPGSGCTALGALIECTLAEIPSGGSAVAAVTLRARSGPAAGPLLVDARSASGGANQSESVAVRLRGPDLAVAATTAPSFPVVRDRSEWAFTVQNLGIAREDKGGFSVIVPVGAFEARSIDGVVGCREVPTGFVCPLPDAARAPGGSAVVTFAGRPLRTGDVTVRASARAEYTPDETAGNDSDAFTTRIRGADFVPSVGFFPDSANPGEDVELRYIVTNSGSADGRVTTGSLGLGGRLAVVSAPPGCSVAQGVASCIVPELTIGAMATFSFTVRPSGTGDITVVGEVAAEDDEDAANNRQSGRLIMVAVDSDGDGTPDSVEDAGPGGGDANGDSVPDRTQPHVASIPVAGHGSLVVEAPSGTTLRSFGLTTPPAAPPAGVTFPMGALTFEVAGVTPGGLLPIRLTFPAGVPAWAYYKFSGGAWSRLDWDGTTGGRPLDARTLELVLRDGGRGDEDGSADGVVRDPGAPGLIGFAVDDAGDAGDAVPGDGLCETASGSCTLRAALEETNAGGEARVVTFAFAEAVVISPSTPLPTVTVPVILDGSAVPDGDFGSKGVTLSGAGLAPGPLLTVTAPGASFIGLGVQDTRGDGFVVRATGVRFAGCSLGAPRSRLVDPFDWATVRADDGDAPAHELALVDSWLGAIHGSALYGAFVEGAADVLVDGLVLGSNRIDGLRPQDELLNGLVLRDTPRARLRGISANGLQDVLRLEGALDGTVVAGGTFGLGTDGLCHAFTRDDPGPAETGTGPCLDGNQRAIVLVGASGVDIGGADESGGNLFGNNVEAVVLDAGSHDNVVRNNRIGLAADGSCQPAFSDGLCRLLVSNGVLVRDSHDNLVGGSGQGNIVGAANVNVYGAGSEDNVIEGNWIGFQTDRVTPVRPGFLTSTPFPLQVAVGATGTQIVDNTVGSLRVVDPATTGTVVRGNRIGVDTTGTREPVGSSYTGGAGWSLGIVLSSAGQTTVEQNTIASYFGYCVGIESSDDVTIADNHIGVTRDGTALTSCLSGPVLVRDSRNTVIEGNTVGRCVDEASASFDSACIFVTEEAGGTVIDGNTIGALLDGPGGAPVEPIASVNPAIVLEAAPSTVIANNRIFGSTYGIYDRGSFFGVANATRIYGNDIGVRDDAPWGGTSDHGMLLVSAGASVGGLGAGSPNRVMGSGGAGIRIGNVQPIVVRQNVLAENARLGIAFNDGGSPESNDSDDSDGGPNGRQNHPLVTTYADAGSPTASVSLTSAASTTYDIDVYAVAVVDPSGYGEADEWLGTAPLTTGADHTGTAVVALSRPLLPGEVVSATATGPDGTSELGPAVRPTTAGLANLSVSLNPAGGASVGVEMPVVLGLFNSGPDAAVGAVVTATVPEGWTWGTPSDVTAGTCSVEGRTVQCVGFDLASFASWSAQVPATPSAVGRFVFEAQAHAEVSDPALDDNFRAAAVDVGAVNYVVTTSAVGGGLRNTGVPIPVNVTHFWLGARADLDDLVLSIALPAGARVSGGELSCQTTGPAGGQTATCDFGPVSRLDASTVRSVELTFDTAYPSGLFVDFTLAGANPNLSRAVAQLGLTVLGGAVGSLTLDASATPEGPLAGAPVTVDVAITNGTATMVDDAVLSVRLPAGSSLLRTDGTCAIADDEVICLLPPLPAAASEAVTLVLAAPAASAEVEACLTRADDADAEPLCGAVTIAPGPVDVAVAVAPAIVDVLSGQRMRLEATVSTTTGAGASEVVWTSDGDARAEGAGCVADGASWRCGVLALGAGAEARVALDLDPAAGELQRWVATVVAAGDAVPANDSATATAYASTVADCGGRDADVLFDGGAGDTPTAAGFAASGPGAVSTAAWVLGGDSGSLTTAPLVLGDDAVALRVAWLQRGDADGLGASRVEVSGDGGATWSVLAGDAAGDELGEGWRERVLSLGAPGAAPLAVRWRAEGGVSGAWALDALRVVACRADDDADLELTANAALVESAELVPVDVGFVLTNGGSAVSGLSVVITADAAVSLSGATIEGGACAADGAGRIVCDVAELPADAELAIAVQVDSGGADAIALVEATAAAWALSGAGEASTLVRFGAAPFGPSEATLAWVPEALTLAPDGQGEARLTLARAGRRGLGAGRLVVAAPAGVALDTADGRCEGSQRVLRCQIDESSDAAADDDVELGVAIAGAGSVEVRALWEEDSGGLAEATLAIDAGPPARATAEFVSPEDLPDAGGSGFATLRVGGPEGTDALVVEVVAQGDLTVAPGAGAEAFCAAGDDGRSLRCQIGARSDALDLRLDLSAEDAGVLGLTATTVSSSPHVTSLVWLATRDCTALPCVAEGCAAATCSATRGCEPLATDGESCDIGPACGPVGVCVAGVCATVGFESCDDGDDCTAELCDTELGCLFERVDTPECDCSALPETSACEGGAWVTRDGCGAEVERDTCDDGDACTGDACVAELGCRYVASTDPGCPGCVPDCDDRECGLDPVCGTSCGSCAGDAVCAFGLCIDDPCDELQPEGCCDLEVLSRCVDGVFEPIDCTEGDGRCGWSDAEGAFSCAGGDPVPDDVEALCPWVDPCADDTGCGPGDEPGGDEPAGDMGVDLDAGLEPDADAGRDASADLESDLGGEDARSDADAVADVSEDIGGAEVGGDRIGPDDPDASGCDCSAVGVRGRSAQPLGWWLVALGTLVTLRRRRRLH